MHELTAVVTTTERTAKITSPITVVTGDDVVLTAELFEDGAAFVISTSATVKAVLRDVYDAALTTVITLADTDPGADWSESTLAMTFPSAVTGAISVTGDTSAILEIQIQHDDVKTWILEGYIVRNGLIDITPATPGDTSPMNDFFDEVANLAARPAVGTNVDGDAVKDGYRVVVTSNQLIYTLINNETAWQVDHYDVTVESTAAFVALTEIDAKQRVHVRELALADQPANFYRNTANTAWLEG